MQGCSGPSSLTAFGAEDVGRVVGEGEGPGDQERMDWVRGAGRGDLGRGRAGWPGSSRVTWYSSSSAHTSNQQH